MIVLRKDLWYITLLLLLKTFKYNLDSYQFVGSITPSIVAYL